MTTPISELARYAADLHAARLHATAMPQLPAGLPIDDAYAVQRAGIALRLTEGETLVGAKLGFTSVAKAKQMGVDDVICGQLTDAMQLAPGDSFDIATAVHPRIEPEVAFRLARDIDPTAPDQDLRAAVDAVAPAMEIIDSRYKDFKFSLADVVADNTSGCAFVVGEWLPLEPGMRLADRAVTLMINGDVVESGSTSDILGDPWEALPAIVRMAAAYGQQLTAGGVILAGAATAAVWMTAGSTVTATVDGLGEVSLTTREAS